MKVKMMKYSSPAGQLQSLKEARSLPADAYTSEKVYAAEQSAIYRRLWIAVGAADRLKEVGDYFDVNVGGQPVLVVRDEDRRVRAFSNVCMHRGTLLCSGSGNAKELICPNHGWRYSLHGNLTDSPWFDRVEGFDPAEASLKRVATKVWSGVVFVNLEDDPPDFEAVLAGAPKEFELYRMDSLRCVDTSSYEFSGNWKLTVENLCEAYHIPFVHGSLEGALPLDDFVYQVNEGAFSSWHYTNKQRDPLEVLGQHGRRPTIPGLAGADLSIMRYWRLFPNLQFLCSPDHVVVLTVLPVSVSCSILTVSILTVDPLVEFDDIRRPLDKAMHEDAAIVDKMQAGLSSSAFVSGRLAVPFENNIFHFHQLLKKYLGESLVDGTVSPYPDATMTE